MTNLYYGPLRRRVANLEKRYFSDRKPANVFCWYDENGEIFEMFGAGISWSKARDGGEPPEITDELIDSTGADVRHGGDRAFYEPANDFIRMPHKHR